MSALIWCPFPDADTAKSVASTLLDEKLVACANMLPGIESLFAWDGKRGEAVECGVLFKTHASILGRAVERIEQLHPYDGPAVMGWRCDNVGASTAEWLGALESEGGVR